jgi:hypothetical protein
MHANAAASTATQPASRDDSRTAPLPRAGMLCKYYKSEIRKSNIFVSQGETGAKNAISSDQPLGAVA